MLDGEDSEHVLDGVTAQPSEGITIDSSKPLRKKTATPSSVTSIPYRRSV